MAVVASRVLCLCVDVTARGGGGRVHARSPVLHLRHDGDRRARRTASLVDPPTDRDGRPAADVPPWMRFIAPIMPLPAFFVDDDRHTEGGRDRQPRLDGWCGTFVALLIYAYLFYWWRSRVAWPAGRHGSCTGAITRPYGVWCCRRDRVVLALPKLIGLAHTTSHRTTTSRAPRRRRLEPLRPPQISILAQRFAIGVPILLALPARPERNRLFIAAYVVPLVLVAGSGVPPSARALHRLRLANVRAPGPRRRQRRAVPPHRRSLATAGDGALAWSLVAAVWFGAFQVRAERQVNPAFAMRRTSGGVRWIDATSTRTDRRSVEHLDEPLPRGDDACLALHPRGLRRRPSDDEIVDRYLRVSAAYGYSADDTFARIDPYDTCHPGQMTNCEDRRVELSVPVVLP